MSDERCPTCGSDDPRMDKQGEVKTSRTMFFTPTPCPDPFHSPVADARPLDPTGRPLEADEVAVSHAQDEANSIVTDMAEYGGEGEICPYCFERDAAQAELAALRERAEALLNALAGYRVPNSAWLAGVDEACDNLRAALNPDTQEESDG